MKKRVNTINIKVMYGQALASFRLAIIWNFV